MFLVHPTLTQAEVDKTCEVVRRVMGGRGRHEASLSEQDVLLEAVDRAEKAMGQRSF
jgi:hypothetical protein